MLEIRHTTRVPLLPCDAVGQNRGMNQLLSADETAARLPYVALAMQIGEVLADPSVQVPERLVQPLPGGRCLSSARARRAARGLGLQAKVVDDPNAALVDCPLVTCTPANAVVLHATPRADTFIAAVGAFTPRMVELGPDLCRHFAAHGKMWPRSRPCVTCSAVQLRSAGQYFSRAAAGRAGTWPPQGQL